MSKLMMAALCSLMLAASPLALAQEKPKKQSTESQKEQQRRMADCNKQAASKKLEGEARKKFMSSCLKEGPAPMASKGTPQQEKMKSCNKQAGDKKLKGDERKKFMGDCLKG